MGIEGTYLNVIKTIYDKPTANSILCVEKLKASPLRPERRKACPPTLTTFIQHSFGGPSHGIQRRKIEEIQVGKEVKCSLFADDVILYIEKS